MAFIVFKNVATLASARFHQLLRQHLPVAGLFVLFIGVAVTTNVAQVFDQPVAADMATKKFVTAWTIAPASSEKFTEMTPKKDMKQRAGNDLSIVRKLITDARQAPTVGAKMRLITQQLMGRPYVTNPLVGSFQQPEQFVTRLDGFDCVTFIESVLALAGASKMDDYPQRLRTLRYLDGEISYAKRLHYTTNWHQANVARGYLQDLTQGGGTVLRSKTLSLLPGFEPQPTSFLLFPKTQLNAVSRWVQDGDLIYFVSARRNLDTYHVGILFRENGRIVMRHAARSRGQVVQEELAQFCQNNRMAGFILARPLR